MSVENQLPTWSLGNDLILTLSSDDQFQVRCINSSTPLETSKKNVIDAIQKLMVVLPIAQNLVSGKPIDQESTWTKMQPDKKHTKSIFDAHVETNKQETDLRVKLYTPSLRHNYCLGQFERTGQKNTPFVLNIPPFARNVVITACKYIEENDLNNLHNMIEQEKSLPECKIKIIDPAPDEPQSTISKPSTPSTSKEPDSSESKSSKLTNIACLIWRIVKAPFIFIGRLFAMIFGMRTEDKPIKETKTKDVKTSAPSEDDAKDKDTQMYDTLVFNMPDDDGDDDYTGTFVLRAVNSHDDQAQYKQMPDADTVES